MKKYLYVICAMIWGSSLEASTQNLYEKIQEKERELAVPRDTVPVQENKFLIDSPIPKTANYLPFLQTLLSIKVGTLPNPIGLSIIGSYTEEKYRVKSFNGMMAPNLGGTIIDQLQPSIKANRDQIIKAINKDASLKPLIKAGLRTLVDKIAVGDPQTLRFLKSSINDISGSGQTKKWELSEGKIKTQTSAVGVKADMFIFPFMQVFATAAYLHMEQSTNVGATTIPIEKLRGSGMIVNLINPLLPSTVTIPVGTISNSLDGWMAMAGTNLAIGYKGFFASLMLSGGYVQLDDNVNGVTGFVQKPFMYIAPRIGYSYHGIATIHFGVQRIELFGATEGKDLTKSTGGLIKSYSVEVEKFPVNFLAGLQFNFARYFGVSLEYVGSPDTNGINAEIAFRF